MTNPDTETTMRTAFRAGFIALTALLLTSCETETVLQIGNTAPCTWVVGEEGICLTLEQIRACKDQNVEFMILEVSP